MTPPTNKKWLRFSRSYDEFFKFDKPGDKLEGFWIGARPGKYDNRLGRVSTDDGKVIAFSLTVALRELELLPTGTEVRIVFSGWEQTKGGFSLKPFQRFTVGEFETGRAQPRERQHREPSTKEDDSSSHEDEGS